MMEDVDQRKGEDSVKSPLTTWVLTGFFITFLAFFILPIFINPSRKMLFDQYIPIRSPIGHDFRVIESASSSWLHTGLVPVTLYPPFTLIFFAPFTFFDPSAGYKLLVSIILLCYVLITLVLPRWISRSKGISAFAMLIFITGLFSYGLQFELERGQWNVIAFTFSLLAVYLFHDHPRLRWLAYVFFTVAVQLKLYPAIFVFALIEDWVDWKNNIKRFVGLGLVNLLALFMFGLAPLLGTPASVADVETFFGEVPYDLSISAFALHIQSVGHSPNGWLLQFLLFSLFVVCFVLILRRAYKRSSKGFNPSVFMACTLGACLIPALSFDYKLSFLPAAVILLLPVLPSLERARNRFLVVILAFLFSIAYSSMLYSYTNKPEILQYDLPALFVLLMICVVLSYVRWNRVGDGGSGVPDVYSNGQ